MYHHVVSTCMAWRRLLFLASVCIAHASKRQHFCVSLILFLLLFVALAQ